MRKKKALILVLGVIIFVAFGINNLLWPIETTALLALSLFAGIAFYALEEEIKQHSFLKHISLDQLEDDEVLAVEHLTHEEKEKLGNIPALIGTEDKKRFSNAGMSHIPVYRHLPKFAPFLLVGVFVTYLFPEWLLPLIPAIF